MANIGEVLMGVLGSCLETGETGVRIQEVIEVLMTYGMENPEGHEALRKAEARAVAQEIIGAKNAIISIVSITSNLVAARGFAKLPALSPYDRDTMKAIEEEKTTTRAQKK